MSRQIVQQADVGYVLVQQGPGVQVSVCQATPVKNVETNAEWKSLRENVGNHAKLKALINGDLGNARQRSTRR